MGGKGHFVMNVRCIQVADMGPVMESLGRVFVTRTGVAYCVIKVGFIII